MLFEKHFLRKLAGGTFRGILDDESEGPEIDWFAPRWEVSPFHEYLPQGHKAYPTNQLYNKNIADLKSRWNAEATREDPPKMTQASEVLGHWPAGKEFFGYSPEEANKIGLNRHAIARTLFDNKKFSKLRNTYDWFRAELSRRNARLEHAKQFVPNVYAYYKNRWEVPIDLRDSYGSFGTLFNPSTQMIGSHFPNLSFKYGPEDRVNERNRWNDTGAPVSSEQSMELQKGTKDSKHEGWHIVVEPSLGEPAPRPAWLPDTADNFKVLAGLAKKHGPAILSTDAAIEEDINNINKGNANKIYSMYYANENVRNDRGTKDDAHSILGEVVRDRDEWGDALVKHELATKDKAGYLALTNKGSNWHPASDDTTHKPDGSIEFDRKEVARQVRMNNMIHWWETTPLSEKKKIMSDYEIQAGDRAVYMFKHRFKAAENNSPVVQRKPMAPWAARFARG